MRYARRSLDLRFVICGACHQALCRRDERLRPGGPAHHVDGHWEPGYERQWLLVWDDGWHRVEDHIERSPRVADRLADGWKPVRHDWKDGERFALSRFMRTFPPALCTCGVLNRIDRKRLGVNGVAARDEDRLD
jgi:hypothetical protein